MTDQEFRDMLLTTLADIKVQEKERYDRLEKRFEIMEAQRKEDSDRLEKRFEIMEAQRKEDSDRLEKRLDSIETKARENNERLEKRLDSMDTSVAQLRQDVGWVKGKLEGKQEGSGRMLTVFTTGAAIAAVILALIALFN